MKGIVFTLLERVVSDEYGEDVWDDLLVAAQVEGAYTAVGLYPDGELAALVSAASRALKQDPDDVVRWFGERTVPLFASRYGEMFASHDCTRSLVLSLNDVIHPEVRKLHPGALTPEFVFDNTDPERLSLDYRSPRQLCAFAEGLIVGTGRHYGEDVRVEHVRCTKRGDDRCTLTVSVL